MIWLVHFHQRSFQPFAVGIGNKQLSLVLYAYPMQEVVHAALVEFFEYIVEQQYGRETFKRFQQFKLGQLKGKEQAFALSLRSRCFKRLFAERDDQIIAVDALRGALQQ